MTIKKFKDFPGEFESQCSVLFKAVVCDWRYLVSNPTPPMKLTDDFGLGTAFVPKPITWGSIKEGLFIHHAIYNVNEAILIIHCWSIHLKLYSKVLLLGRASGLPRGNVPLLTPFCSPSAMLHSVLLWSVPSFSRVKFWGGVRFCHRWRKNKQTNPESVLPCVHRSASVPVRGTPSNLGRLVAKAFGPYLLKPSLYESHNSCIVHAFIWLC